MKANENTVGHAADADDNTDKKSKLGAPISSVLFQADKGDKPSVSADWDAEAGTAPLAPTIFGMGVYPNNVSDDFQDEDVPKENLF